MDLIITCVQANFQLISSCTVVTAHDTHIFFARYQKCIFLSSANAHVGAGPRWVINNLQDVWKYIIVPMETINLPPGANPPVHGTLAPCISCALPIPAQRCSPDSRELPQRRENSRIDVSRPLPSASYHSVESCMAIAQAIRERR